jgi:hypothetical protein
MCTLVTNFLLRYVHMLAAAGGPGVVQVLGVGIHFAEGEVQGVDSYMEDMGRGCQDLMKTLWEAKDAYGQSIFTKFRSGFILKEAPLESCLFTAATVSFKWYQPALSARGVQLWFGASARGLDRLHDAGLTHCDLKPENQIAGAAPFVRAVMLGKILITPRNAEAFMAYFQVRTCWGQQLLGSCVWCLSCIRGAGTAGTALRHRRPCRSCVMYSSMHAV